MDEDEDFEALFFTECQELLSDLQEHLNALASGDTDMERVNAAFRAVHSVKGGAAAFGFDDLIAFAHVFETVMDKVRSGRLGLTGDLCQLFMRAGDVMEVLIEAAQMRSSEIPETVGRVRAELDELSDSPVEPAQTEAPVSPPAEDAPVASKTELAVVVRPLEGFFAAGLDPLKMIRAAQALGLTSANAVGEVPPLDQLDPANCPLSWRLSFETDKNVEDLKSFFEMYAEAAELVTEAGPEILTAASAEPAPTPPQPRDPAPAPAPQRDDAAVARSAPSKSLRVELARVDRLVNLVGEIVITQAALAQELNAAAGAEHDVAHSVEAMSRQTRELQESVMAIRAQPVKSVFSRMPRVVRDLAETLNKKARLVLAGEHTEVDTTVIEELAEPLTHMLRNSMDHGLEDAEGRLAASKPETGTIHLSAEHRGERVIISIEDDGRGINRERVLEKAVERGLVQPDENLTPDDIDNLIFHPGFSTADKISSVSGRGVGMDVVKKKIQALGGRCHVRSTPGQGTRFQVTLPLTLAVLDGMTIVVGNDRYILPLSSVVEALRIESCEVERLPSGGQVLVRRGEYLPLISLREALSIPEADHGDDMAIIVDTETQGNVALLVDDLIGQRQVVLKSLEANFRRVDGVSGATILGDGRVALILDVPGLVGMASGATHAITETMQ